MADTVIDISAGIQLSELPLLKSPGPVPSIPVRQATSTVINKTGSIKIIRNRMFYARPGLNAKGSVRLGLQHIRKLGPDIGLMAY